jgi:hypothetical protein
MDANMAPVKTPVRQSWYECPAPQSHLSRSSAMWGLMRIDRRLYALFIVCSIIVTHIAVVVPGQDRGAKPPELSRLVASAPIIVDASVETKFLPYLQATIITRTDVVLRVNRVVKGNLRVGDQVLIAQAGNEAAIQRNDAEKPMQLGERYLLFLQLMPSFAISQFPVREGLTRYGSLSSNVAVKINGSNVEIDPAMPFHRTLNGRGVDEFLREVSLFTN